MYIVGWFGSIGKEGATRCASTSTRNKEERGGNVERTGPGTDSTGLLRRREEHPSARARRRLQSHHHPKSPCQRSPGQGHEKGQVEHGVGYSRRNFLVPIPEAASYEELNKQLLERCHQEDARQVSRQTQSIGEAWEQERERFLMKVQGSQTLLEMYLRALDLEAFLDNYSITISKPWN